MGIREIIDNKALKKSNVIEKKVKVTFDGKQRTIKIPSQITEKLKINDKYKAIFQLVIPEDGTLPTLDDLTIWLIKNGD